MSYLLMTCLVHHALNLRCTGFVMCTLAGPLSAGLHSSVAHSDSYEGIAQIDTVVSSGLL